jgi:hypothetical protein
VLGHDEIRADDSKEWNVVHQEHQEDLLTSEAASTRVSGGNGARFQQFALDMEPSSLRRAEEALEWQKTSDIRRSEEESLAESSIRGMHSGVGAKAMRKSLPLDRLSHRGKKVFTRDIGMTKGQIELRQKRQKQVKMRWSREAKEKAKNYRVLKTELKELKTKGRSRKRLAIAREKVHKAHLKQQAMAKLQEAKHKKLVARLHEKAAKKVRKAQAKVMAKKKRMAKKKVHKATTTKTVVKKKGGSALRRVVRQAKVHSLVHSFRTHAIARHVREAAYKRNLKHKGGAYTSWPPPAGSLPAAKIPETKHVHHSSVTVTKALKKAKKGKKGTKKAKKGKKKARKVLVHHKAVMHTKHGKAKGKEPRHIKATGSAALLSQPCIPLKFGDEQGNPTLAKERLQKAPFPCLRKKVKVSFKKMDSVKKRIAWKAYHADKSAIATMKELKVKAIESKAKAKKAKALAKAKVRKFTKGDGLHKLQKKMHPKKPSKKAKKTEKAVKKQLAMRAKNLSSQAWQHVKAVWSGKVTKSHRATRKEKKIVRKVRRLEKAKKQMKHVHKVAKAAVKQHEKKITKRVVVSKELQAKADKAADKSEKKGKMEKKAAASRLERDLARKSLEKKAQASAKLSKAAKAKKETARKVAISRARTAAKRKTLKLEKKLKQSYLPSSPPYQPMEGNSVTKKVKNAPKIPSKAHDTRHMTTAINAAANKQAAKKVSAAAPKRVAAAVPKRASKKEAQAVALDQTSSPKKIVVTKHKKRSFATFLSDSDAAYEDKQFEKDTSPGQLDVLPKQEIRREEGKIATADKKLAELKSKEVVTKAKYHSSWSDVEEALGSMGHDELHGAKPAKDIAHYKRYIRAHARAASLQRAAAHAQELVEVAQQNLEEQHAKFNAAMSIRDMPDDKLGAPRGELLQAVKTLPAWAATLFQEPKKKSATKKSSAKGVAHAELHEHDVTEASARDVLAVAAVIESDKPPVQPKPHANVMLLGNTTSNFTAWVAEANGTETTTANAQDPAIAAAGQVIAGTVNKTNAEVKSWHASENTWKAIWLHNHPQSADVQRMAELEEATADEAQVTAVSDAEDDAEDFLWDI